VTMIRPGSSENRLEFPEVCRPRRPLHLLHGAFPISHRGTLFGRTQLELILNFTDGHGNPMSFKAELAFVDQGF
jgi:hypothetical protein